MTSTKMKCVFTFMTFAFIFSACGDARVNFITSDVLKDAVGCYTGTKVFEDTYLITLNKTCIDFELSDWSGIPPVDPPVQVVVDWVLLATLERDLRQRYWHEFHIQADWKDPLLTAYADGKDFLFVIENPEINSIWPIQFYFAQPEVPFNETSNAARSVLFYECPPHWYTHWGPETVDRSASGFIVDFDLGFPGRDFRHPDNRAKDWVGGSIKIGATRNGQQWYESHAPAIKVGYVLKIYTR